MKLDFSPINSKDTIYTFKKFITKRDNLVLLIFSFLSLWTPFFAKLEPVWFLIVEAFLIFVFIIILIMIYRHWALLRKYSKIGLF